MKKTFKAIIGGENTYNQHFLHSMIFTLYIINTIISTIFNSLPKTNFWTRPNSKHLETTYVNVTTKIEICFGKGRKHCGKRTKCWLPAFSPFPTMFSKGLFKVVIEW